MDRCSPVEMRKNLQTVEQYRKIGLDFVAVPVKDDDHKNEMLAYGNEVMEEIISEIET